ncbi:MAG: Gfo/Idh/MocA family protein, partial [Planctomycetota bacterium]
MGPINTAVVGAGILGEVHAKAYSEYHRSRLLWVCDIDVKRARKLARKHRCKWTTDAADIAGDGDVHAVSVATPDFAHADIVMIMLKAGKDVLCEKPLATEAAEARRMVKEARKRGLRLMVDFQNRWNPLFVEAKKQIDSGVFGDFVSGFARLSNTYWVPTKMISWAGKSGPESFLMPHLVDTVRWLSGCEPVEVYASGQKKILKSMGIDAFDAVQAMVRFDTGAFCTFESAWIMPESWPSVIDFKVSLQGSKGKIEVNGDNQGISVSGREHRMPTILPAESAFGKTIGFFHVPMLHFIDCIVEGREPAATGEDGLVATEVIEAVHKSIAGGRVVRIR